MFCGETFVYGRKHYINGGRWWKEDFNTRDTGARPVSHVLLRDIILQHFQLC